MKKTLELPGSFAEMNLGPALLHGLAKANFKEPSDIQKAVIPIALQGRDIVGQARTGTGKTAAFAIPILQNLHPERGFQALVLVPTRELAVQVAAEFRRLGADMPLRCVPVYGGQKISHQIKLLGRKPHIVVATPGRMLDMLGRNLLRLDEVRIAVLDEVDRMLDIGFRDDIRRILGQIRHKHQTIFVSATITDDIRRLVDQYANDPVALDVSRDQITVDEIDQYYLSVQAIDKYRLLRLLLRQEDPRLAIVFTNTKHAARKLAARLHHDGVDAKEIHGDLVQQKRERVMERFRKHNLRVLVATDLAARGIDVSAVSHIINYDVPNDTQVYVHRIGRTARMGARGKAYMFVMPDQGKELTEIESLINREIPKIELDGFEPSPPMREVEEKPAPVMLSRNVAPRFADRAAGAAPAPAAPVRRTLGSKFPSRRRRR